MKSCRLSHTLIRRRWEFPCWENGRRQDEGEFRASRWAFVITGEIIRADCHVVLKISHSRYLSFLSILAWLVHSIDQTSQVEE